MAREDFGEVEPKDAPAPQPTSEIITGTDTTPAEVDESYKEGLEQSSPTPPQAGPPPVLPTVAAPTPPLSDGERQEFSRLRAESAAMAARAEETQYQAALGQKVQSIKAELVAQGYDEAMAQRFAIEQGRALDQAYQAHLASQQEIKGNTAKLYVALHIAEKYGVAPLEMMAYRSPEDMERFGQAQKRIKDLEGQVAKLTQAQVPAQQFDNNQGRGGPKTSRQTLLERAASGDVSDEKDWDLLFPRK